MALGEEASGPRAALTAPSPLEGWRKAFPSGCALMGPQSWDSWSRRLLQGGHWGLMSRGVPQAGSAGVKTGHCRGHCPWPGGPQKVAVARGCWAWLSSLAQTEGVRRMEVRPAGRQQRQQGWRAWPGGPTGRVLRAIRFSPLRRKVEAGPPCRGQRAWGLQDAFREGQRPARSERRLCAQTLLFITRQQRVTRPKRASEAHQGWGWTTEHPCSSGLRASWFRPPPHPQLRGSRTWGGWWCPGLPLGTRGPRQQPPSRAVLNCTQVPLSEGQARPPRVPLPGASENTSLGGAIVPLARPSNSLR